VCRSCRTAARERLLEVELLSDVHEHGHDLVEAVVLLEPRDRAARVEPAGIGEHGGAGHAAAPSTTWSLSSSRSTAAATPSRGATKIVSSPASVPSTCGWFDSSSARASAFAWPGGVRIMTRWPFDSQVSAQRANAAARIR